ncbi:hypothetical protein VM1G_07582 [Cytospora mali]|uniref:Uncharacterized protein n=1 Tax=Cytospora mali TaxID=578113 RepID=A0A194W8G4_CYTMA|nr:hypothetical protein VM1G_07582 [Valsa mali]
MAFESRCKLSVGLDSYMAHLQFCDFYVHEPLVLRITATLRYFPSCQAISSPHPGVDDLVGSSSLVAP